MKRLTPTVSARGAGFRRRACVQYTPMDGMAGVRIVSVRSGSDLFAVCGIAVPTRFSVFSASGKTELAIPDVLGLFSFVSILKISETLSKLML